MLFPSACHANCYRHRSILERLERTSISGFQSLALSVLKQLPYQLLSAIDSLGLLNLDFWVRLKKRGRPSLLLTMPTSPGILLSVTEVSVMTKPKDLVQGTLDLLILRIVALESMHGWAIAHRIRQMSSDVLQVGQSALYPALHKLEQQGWIKAEWNISETNRRAKYYSLTRAGRKALTEEAANWERLSAAISAVVRTV